MSDQQGLLFCKNRGSHMWFYLRSCTFILSATCYFEALVGCVTTLFEFALQVILCTDGRANIGLGDMEQAQSSSGEAPYFYRKLAMQAVEKGWENIEHTLTFNVNSTFGCFCQILNEIWTFFSFFRIIISVMSFKGTDCCLADIGRLADVTGGRVRHKNK